MRLLPHAPVFNECPCPTLLFTRPLRLEILLLAWGVFFIARHNDTTPKQKARNFVKAIRRGVQRSVQRDNRPVAIQGPSQASTVASSPESGVEEHPDGDIAQGGPSDTNGSSVGDKASAHESTV